MTFQTRVTIILVAIILMMEIGVVAPCDGERSKSFVATSNGAHLGDSDELNRMDRENSGEVLSIEETVWGGMHVRLVIKASGAEVEFDCAHGEITEPFKTDRQGRFDLSGTFIREGGPTRLDESESGEPARYSGKVTGATMTLVVTLTDSNQKLDALSLRRGNPGRLRKCK